MALVSMVVLTGISGAILVETLATNRQRNARINDHRAADAAQAGVAHVVGNLFNEEEGNVGGLEAPIQFGEGAYWVNVAPNGDDTFTVTSTGVCRDKIHTIEVVLQGSGNQIFNNAIFVGNSDGDPNYTLELSGNGSQGDLAVGDVYCGGDIDVSGDASVTGSVAATGTVTGHAGQSNAGQQVLPDLAGQNFESTADIDVLAEFIAGSSYQSDNAGGRAYQLPESNPAHIFRVNPSDRKNEYQSTEKHDFFLEDPYESVGVDRDQDGGGDGFGISISGTNGEPGPNSNNQVYFIDGNLWLHNKRTYTLELKHNESNGVQITFVVKGNIYFSDNFFYDNEGKDGVAFVAMEDPNVSDSGNIYFGDPAFGTLAHMQGFMYAENNFYDTNLDASGSTQVTVDGTISAGNQVLIDRDHGNSHTKLVARADSRMNQGTLQLPGIPGLTVSEPSSFPTLSYRKVASPDWGGYHSGAAVYQHDEEDDYGS